MQVSAFVAVSLDGFFARDDGNDWLHPTAGADYGFARFLESVDAIVVGRRTYERLLGYRHWPYADRPTMVLSSRPVDVPVDLVRHVESTRLGPAQLVSRLAMDGRHNVFVDGGVAIQSFLTANRLSDLTITRLPWILGEGLPLFAPGVGDHALEHVASTAFSDGLVQSRYRLPGAHLNLAPHA